jgi:hypothetical protein
MGYYKRTLMCPALLKFAHTCMYMLVDPRIMNLNYYQLELLSLGPLLL